MSTLTHLSSLSINSLFYPPACLPQNVLTFKLGNLHLLHPVAQTPPSCGSWARWKPSATLCATATSGWSSRSCWSCCCSSCWASSSTACRATLSRSCWVLNSLLGGRGGERSGEWEEINRADADSPTRREAEGSPIVPFSPLHSAPISVTSLSPSTLALMRKEDTKWLRLFPTQVIKNCLIL